MTMRSGFFESDIIGYDSEGLPILDRAEDAEFHAEYFASFIGNGVFPNPSDNFKVKAHEGMTLESLRGRCWIEGYFGFDPESELIKLDDADPVLDRIDRIVLRRDLQTRDIQRRVKKGTPATDPVPPPLSRPETDGNVDVHEMGIADVRVTKNTTTITQDKITDLRLSTELCGIVHGVVDQVDTQAIFEQYEKYLIDNIKYWESTKAQQTEDWQNQMTQQDTDWQEQRDYQKTDYDVWFAAAKADITTLQSFYYHNWAELKGCDYYDYPKNAAGEFVSEIKVADKLVARQVEWKENGAYFTRIDVYEFDGETIRKTATRRDYKTPEGVWKGEVT